jgi:hypothetical protein
LCYVEQAFECLQNQQQILLAINKTTHWKQLEGDIQHWHDKRFLLNQPTYDIDILVIDTQTR